MVPTISKIAGVASHLWAKIFVPVRAGGSSTVGCAIRFFSARAIESRSVKCAIWHQPLAITSRQEPRFRRWTCLVYSDIVAVDRTIVITACFRPCEQSCCWFFFTKHTSLVVLSTAFYTLLQLQPSHLKNKEFQQQLHDQSSRKQCYDVKIKLHPSNVNILQIVRHIAFTDNTWWVFEKSQALQHHNLYLPGLLSSLLIHIQHLSVSSFLCSYSNLCSIRFSCVWTSAVISKVNRKSFLKLLSTMQLKQAITNWFFSTCQTLTYF